MNHRQTDLKSPQAEQRTDHPATCLRDGEIKRTRNVSPRGGERSGQETDKEKIKLIYTMKQHHSQCVKNLLLGTVRLTNLMTRLSASARRYLVRATVAAPIHRVPTERFHIPHATNNNSPQFNLLITERI